MKLYDKNGKAHNVPHAVDVKEWIATGKLFKVNPKAGKANKSLLPEEVVDSAKANELVRNLDKINADDVRALALYLKIDYTTKEETILAIKNR